jgi:hypothetical protein
MNLCGVTPKLRTRPFLVTWDLRTWACCLSDSTSGMFIAQVTLQVPYYPIVGASLARSCLNLCEPRAALFAVALESNNNSARNSVRLLNLTHRRLSLKELHQTVQRIAPLGVGKITQEDFHRFLVTTPRTMGQLLKVRHHGCAMYTPRWCVVAVTAAGRSFAFVIEHVCFEQVIEKDVVPQVVESYRRMRHKQHRKSYHAEVSRICIMSCTVCNGHLLQHGVKRYMRYALPPQESHDCTHTT